MRQQFKYLYICVRTSLKYIFSILLIIISRYSGLIYVLATCTVVRGVVVGTKLGDTNFFFDYSNNLNEI